MTKKDFFKSSFVLLGAGLMGFASCTNEDENSVTPDKKGLVSVEIRGGINDGRTHLDGLNVEFDSNDELAVWDGVAKREFKTDAGGSVAVFKGEIAENASQLNILYPYSAGQNCASGTITATIPAKQTTTKDSFDPKANLSVATATYTKGQNVTCTLENVCGLLKFTIANDAPEDSYDSIQIAGKGNEKIAGTVTITDKQIDAASGDATIVTLGDATNKLEKNNTYYVVLKPGTFASGLKMTFYNGGAQVDEPMTIVSTKNTGGGFEIKPGVILNAKEVKPEKGEPVFSVSGTTKVKFAPGNLYCTRAGNATDGWTYSFAFEAKQWDYRCSDGIITSGDKAHVTQNDGTVITATPANTSGLFQWLRSTLPSGIAANDEAKENFGAFSTLADGVTTGTDTDSLFKDYGKCFGDNSKWRTLTGSEWIYLFSQRKNADDTGGTNTARYAKVTVHDVPGMLLIPDGYAVSSSKTEIGGVEISNVNGASTSFDLPESIITDENWTKLEEDGCVFLPCAGFRRDKEGVRVGEFGYYWSSSPYASNPSNAHRVNFTTSTVYWLNSTNRNNGSPVRLVYLYK